MDRVMTPEEFIKQPGREHNTLATLIADYAAYVISKQPKKDILLPEYKEIEDTWDNESFAFNQAIDEVKRLNNIQ